MRKEKFRVNKFHWIWCGSTWTACQVTRKGHHWNDILSCGEWGLSSPWWRYCSQRIWSWYFCCLGHGFSTLEVCLIIYLTHFQNFVLVLNFGIDFIRGGILFWSDSLGSKYICSRLEKWSELYGQFFKACAYLAARAAKGIPLMSNLSSFISFSFKQTICHVILGLFSNLR